MMRVKNQGQFAEQSHHKADCAHLSAAFLLKLKVNLCKAMRNADAKL